MYCVSVGASGRLRGSICGLLCIAFLYSAASPAEARARRAPAYEPRYADIVVDVNSGDVLRSEHADSQRYPASLAKIMTLYLLFEQMQAGKLKLSTRLEVSPAAAAQPPSKLGIKPGQTISVEDAIKALVTKSANDVAVVVAEAVAGSEEAFARLMTRKARALGMTRTTYKNASGLPDEDQITTARDQALLAIAIQERFPSQYDYFSTPSFRWKNRAMRNHNRLLGRVEGVDGIKTGYTRASGFNLVTSVRRGKRHIVAVVIGGRTGGARDARMRELIGSNIALASVRRTAPKIADTQGAAAARPAQVASADKASAIEGAATKSDAATTATIPLPPAAPAAALAAGSTDPIRPNAVKTVSVKPSNLQVASAAPLALVPQTSPTPHSTVAVRGADTLPPLPPGARPGVLGVLTSTAQPETRPAAPVAVAKSRSGWIIQVGAFEAEQEARERLASVQEKAAKLLSNGEPFTEPVTKGDKTLYRARFAGLKPDQAQAACRHLKNNDIACMAIRN